MKFQAPSIRNDAAREKFLMSAGRIFPNPDSLWVGGYVDYEWEHARHVYESANLVHPGCKVLEFGCNIGATSIVLAAMGADVSAIDVNPDFVEIAALNAQSYGLQDHIAFSHVADTTHLPFADASFDLVTCNSVLEYVPHNALAAVQREIDRILRPGGAIAVQGTSNRMWPREVHSERWFTNYLPRWIDALMGVELQRGVFGRQMRHGFGPHYVDTALLDDGAAYLAARNKFGADVGRMRLLTTATRLLAPLGISLGLLTPNISLILKKRV